MSMALGGKNVDFTTVIAMIEEMVSLLRHCRLHRAVRMTVTGFDMNRVSILALSICSDDVGRTPDSQNPVRNIM